MRDVSKATTRGVTSPEFILQHTSSRGKPMIKDQLLAGKFRMWPRSSVTAFFPGTWLSGLWAVAKEV